MLVATSFNEKRNKLIILVLIRKKVPALKKQ